jgi:hypothetical protein
VRLALALGIAVLSRDCNYGKQEAWDAVDERDQQVWQLAAEDVAQQRLERKQQCT